MRSAHAARCALMSVPGSSLTLRLAGFDNFISLVTVAPQPAIAMEHNATIKQMTTVLMVSLYKRALRCPDTGIDGRMPGNTVTFWHIFESGSVCHAAAAIPQPAIQACQQRQAE
jgi:hypothetical protein